MKRNAAFFYMVWKRFENSPRAIATYLLTLLTISIGLGSHLCSMVLAASPNGTIQSDKDKFGQLPPNISVELIQNLQFKVQSSKFKIQNRIDSSLKQSKPNMQLVNANLQFGLKLFSNISKSNGDSNVFVSPTSIAIALSMLYNGASGTTQQEMTAAMSLSGLDIKTLNEANQSLRETLKNPDPNISVAIANSLWSREGFSFRHQFLRVTRQFYDAQVTSLDFASPDAVGIVNQWVDENTQGKITRIIDRLDPNDVLFLINAIYFKGSWTNQFDTKLTAQQPFYLTNGTSKQHPLMSRQGKYRYYENQQFQAVRLPYGRNQLSMYVFLPKKDSNLNSFIGQLSPQNWNQWLSQFKERQGLVKIPRFKIQYEIELKNALAALGMKTMFDEAKADFTDLTSEKVKVDSVKHKTFVEVNEEGTEAAGVTSIGIQVTSVAPTTAPFTMIVDRPFLCAIRDDRTGTILFMGKIVNP
jgi:serine protease inhibitor